MSTGARYLAVIDLETTGLNSEKHEIIQIGRVVIDTIERSIVTDLSVSALIRPMWWPGRDLEAMAINKLTEDRLFSDESIPRYVALGLLVKDVNWTNTIIASWGIDFELDFLKAAHIDTGRIVPYPHKGFDIRSAAHFATMKYFGIEYLSLGESCRFHGVDYDENKAHDAFYDASVTAELMLTLLENERSY